MFNWLLRVWHRFGAWLMPGPSDAAHHDPVSGLYRPSNLHARHYR
jgi:hypothetical protein